MSEWENRNSDISLKIDDFRNSELANDVNESIKDLNHFSPEFSDEEVVLWDFKNESKESDFAEFMNSTKLEKDIDAKELDERLWDTQSTEAQKAADYVRSFEGFDKAADYVERHFASESYSPGDIIPVKTRNQDLADSETDLGVKFSRREVILTDGLTIEGVFPEFNSIHHVDLGNSVNDLSLHQQFSACKTDFQEHLYDNPQNLERITFGDMERLDKPQGYAPDGYTWNHNPETGSYDLVPSNDHNIGHTGGNALWGKS